MSDRDKQKQIVLQKWEDLILEMSKHLELAKKSGGTLGHKIGSVRQKQLESFEFYKKYT